MLSFEVNKDVYTSTALYAAVKPNRNWSQFR